MNERTLLALVCASSIHVACTSAASDASTPDVSPALVSNEQGTSSAATAGESVPTPTLSFAENTKAATPPTIEARSATSLGLTAMTANGRVHPHGVAASTYFEYGSTVAYGSRTASRALPPRLSAHYRETWDAGLSGWSGGFSEGSLSHFAQGGQSASSGFVRYGLPGDVDQNHSDGIGVNELMQYMYTGTYEGNGIPAASLSGGNPDLRGAKISVLMRGNSFVPRDADTQALFWIQSTPDPLLVDDPVVGRLTNWAFTGSPLTDALVAGGWQRVDYTLVNDSNLWTYAGNFVDANRATYAYFSIDQALGNVNADIFHMLVFGHPGNEPTGSVDFDEVDITYRNRSLLIGSNGGRLVSAPGTDDAAKLTDGWRNGDGKVWSVVSPTAPAEIVYALDKPVVVNAVQLHQNPTAPAKDVEVLVSNDGVAYTRLSGGQLPATTTSGPSFAFLLDTDARRAAAIADGQELTPWPRSETRFVKVRILSGYSAAAWGLGEIEIFGTGAVMATEDDWYSVNDDITNLAPGASVHYRLAVVTADGTTTYGPDTTFTVPSTNAPEAITGEATKVGSGAAMLGGRVNPLGLTTTTAFEYGTTTSYGERTPWSYAGVQITRRGAAAKLEELVPGTTYHYRLVATNATGTSYGADATFIAK